MEFYVLDDQLIFINTEEEVVSGKELLCNENKFNLNSLKGGKFSYFVKDSHIAIKCNSEDAYLLRSEDLDEPTLEPLKEYVADIEDLVNTPEKYALNMSMVINNNDILGILAGFSTSAVLNYSRFTVPQKYPQDPLWVQIPTLEDIASNSYSVPGTAISQLNYPSKAFTRQWLTVMGVNGLNNEDITGHEDLNDLPIQENEQEYYDALCALIKLDASKEFVGLNMEDIIAEGYKPANTSKYLQDMCNWALANTRKHTGRVSYHGTESKDDTQDEDAEVEESSLSNVNDAELDTNAGVFDPVANITTLKSSTALVKGYVDSSVNLFGWAETLIKLLRWGENKPRRLKIDGVNTYLDLESFEFSEFSGKISGIPKKDELGNNRFTTKLVTMNTVFGDADYYKDTYQGGAVCLARFACGISTIIETTKEDGTPEATQVSYIDLLTLVNEYVVNKNRKFKASFIDYVDGKFVVDEILKAGIEDGATEPAVDIPRMLIEQPERYRVEMNDTLQEILLKYKVSTQRVLTVFRLAYFQFNTANLAKIYAVSDFESTEEATSLYMSNGISVENLIFAKSVCELGVERLWEKMSTEIEVTDLEGALNFIQDWLVKEKPIEVNDHSTGRFVKPAIEVAPVAKPIEPVETVKQVVVTIIDENSMPLVFMTRYKPLTLIAINDLEPSKYVTKGRYPLATIKSSDIITEFIKQRNMGQINPKDYQFDEELLMKIFGV